MINLLPQKVKQELRQEQEFRFLLIFLYMFTVVLVCFVLMLGVIKVYIAGSLVSHESKIALFEERFSKDNPILIEIQGFNETISQVSRFLKSRHLISPVLESF